MTVLYFLGAWFSLAILTGLFFGSLFRKMNP